MIHRISSLVAMAVVTLIISMPAWADEVAELNEEGINAFQEKRFVEAAEKFRAAWEIEPEPALRKNEAIAWFKAGRCEEALEAASSYVSYGEEDEEAREDAESVIANCKVELARAAMDLDDFELAEKMLDETRDLRVDEYAREQINLARLDLARARGEQSDEADATAQVEATAPAPSTVAGDPTLAWILTGAGGAIFVSALIYHIVVLASVAPEHEDVGEAGEDRARFEDLSSTLDTARWLVPTLYLTGAASAGVGIYLLLDSGEITHAVSPDLGPRRTTSTTLMIRTRF